MNTSKIPTKKAPAKAGAMRFLPTKSLISSEAQQELEGLSGYLNALRPFLFSEKEWTLVQTAVEGFVDAASKGRTAETQELLKTCASFLRAGQVPPEPANSWLIERLESIASEDSPWGCPLVARKAGQKNADEYWIQLIAASYYEQLRREGEKSEVAKRIVSEKMSSMSPGLTPDKVLNYWRKSSWNKRK